MLSCIPADAEDSGTESDQEKLGAFSRARGSDAMSKSHSTGLAKLPDGLEWLLNAIGGSRRLGNGGSSQADDNEPMPKFLIFAHHKYASLTALSESFCGQSGLEFKMLHLQQ